MSFSPPRCPYRNCPSRRGSPFLWRKKGFFARRCDQRRVPRFLCLACKRSFSRQTFRLDYRLRLPDLHQRIFEFLISKVTHRQTARLLGCARKTVHHRLRLLGEHSKAYQRRLLRRAAAEGGIQGSFQLDELETYEHSQKLCPVTMPVLIETHSYFVLDVQVGTLPCRGKLKPFEQQRKLERERVEGKRISQSRQAVQACFRTLERVLPPKTQVVVATDKKSSYAKILRERLGARVIHARHSSKGPRNYFNRLFPINHTLAMLRDGLSRLVRRNWAGSKKRKWLERHAWVWIAYRNFVRSITNDSRNTSAAMALKLADRLLDAADLFTWRVVAMPD